MKILLLTTIYPSPDLTLMNGTNVCHYFTKEWVKTGHEVKVVFNYPVYSNIVHYAADLLGKRAASLGQSYFITKKITELKEFTIDGVTVLRAPLYKIFPKVSVKKKNISAQIDIIIDFLNKEQFTPDVIVGHFCYPHLEIIAKLKERFHCRTAIVNHIQSLPLQRYIGPAYKDYMKAIDTWGYRSENIKRSFEAQFGKQKKDFLCPSGVPLGHILQQSRSFGHIIKKYVYVGSLIKRKEPLSILNALHKYSEVLTDLELTYVGDGAEKKLIIEKIATCDFKVNLRGNLSRNEVFELLDDAECFIMISRGETFGLVYLEAMARGLITVASRGEGMEGIIIDGFNGFLCEAGNEDELLKVLKRINSLSIKERNIISSNAIDTAFKYSDKNVAEHYLNAIK